MLWCGKDDARHCAARLANGTVLHDFYIPAGGDEPDREKNEKFGHKLDFVEEATRWSEGLKGSHILVGDLNIAPFEDDVWSHKQLLKVVSHTPVETEAMGRMREAGDWTDTTRADIPQPTRVYSWWSYRAKDWEAADKGRRLDHIWERGSKLHIPGSSRVLKEFRGKEKPSDHAPVHGGFRYLEFFRPDQNSLPRRLFDDRTCLRIYLDVPAHLRQCNRCCQTFGINNDPLCKFQCDRQ